MMRDNGKLSKNIEEQVYKILYQVLADAKTEVDIELILKSLMSISEVQSVAKRLAIAVFLDKGQSQARIQDVLKVSPTRVARVKQAMNERGMKMALERVKAEQWADVWSIRISRALEKLLK